MASVTVIIPTLPHREKLLQRAVDSVFEQTFTDWQIMIVPNGPVDKHDYGNLIDVVPLGRPWNFGFGAVNRVVAGFLCNTEFQAFLDDDNFYLPDHLELCMNAIGDNDMVYTRMYRDWDDEGRRDHVTGSEWHEGTEDKLFLDASNIVIRTSALCKAMPDPYFGSGWEADFAVRLFHNGGTFAYVPEPTVVYTGSRQSA